MSASIWTIKHRKLGHAHEVIDVENTVSPKILLSAPNDLPMNDWPDLKLEVQNSSSCRGVGGKSPAKRMEDNSSEGHDFKFNG